MFVRGLQASYNLYAPHIGVDIPYGDILVFGFCCGQIMYSWLLSPDTIPPEYRAWYVSGQAELTHQDSVGFAGPFGRCYR
jgi:hypothetical protein